MSWKADSFAYFSRRLRQAAERRHYRNFAWVLQWDITYVCPLSCSYCAVPHLKDHGDSRRALQEVLRLRPKLLTITGGEPILEPNIVSMLRTVKEKIDPFTILTTSLMGPEAAIEGILPYTDILHVSLDGLDEHNRVNRGYGSSTVLRRLERVAELRGARDYEENRGLLTLAVLTPHNAPHVRELAERVAGIDPRIVICFSTVEPPTHPLSLMHRPELLDELLPELVALRERYNVVIVGPLGSRALRVSRLNVGTPEPESVEAPPASGGRAAYYCPRQYFRAMMDPDGNLRSCKDSRLLDGGIRDMGAALEDRRWRDAARALWYVLDILFVHPHSPQCRYPCKCEEFVDDVLMSRPGEPVLHEFHMLERRFSTPELDAAAAYVERHFNSRWNPAVRELLLRS